MRIENASTTTQNRTEAMITHARLLELLTYDQETGEFRWRMSRPGCAPATLAGAGHSLGYRRIYLDRKSYYAHRLAWLFVHGIWPTNEIDHIDGDKTNNAISNLREATRSENLRNRGKLVTNSSGYKGVSWSKMTHKWEVTITVNRKQRNVGFFDDIEDAARAYSDAARRLHGSFANDSGWSASVPDNRADS